LRKGGEERRKEILCRREVEGEGVLVILSLVTAG